MRINDQDVRIKLDYLNELLERHGSDRRMHYGRYNNYYKLEERDITLTRTFEDYRDQNGSKRDIYNILVAMISAIRLITKQA